MSVHVTGYRSVPTSQVPILLIDTDVGLTGVALGPHEAIEELFPIVLGGDPHAVTALYDRMIDAVFDRGHQGAVFATIGAIDTALWDLKAKLVELPLWRLLGAADRNVPAYAGGADLALSLDELDRRFVGFAEHGFASAELTAGPDPDIDLVRLDVVSAALEGNTRRPTLALDAGERWSPKQAIRHVAAVEERLDLTWISAPVRRWDADGSAAVRAAVRAAVVAGENLTGLEQFRALVAAGGADVLRAGGGHGITHFLRVAALAHAFDRPVSPGAHPCEPLAHAAAAVGNHLAIGVRDLRHPAGVEVDHHIADGAVILGDAPGLGITVNPDDLAPPSRLSSTRQ